MVSSEERREPVDERRERIGHGREADFGREPYKLERDVERLEQAPGRDAQHERAEQRLQKEGRVILRGRREDFDLDVFFFLTSSSVRQQKNRCSAVFFFLRSAKTLTSSRRSGAAAARTLRALRR